MGELTTQLLSGGPPEIELADLPHVKKLMTTPGVRWEIYRMLHDIRERLALVGPGAAARSALFVYAEISAVANNHGDMLTEQEARSVASFMVGEWIHADVAEAFRAAVRAHVYWTRDHIEICRVASLAIAACARAGSNGTKFGGLGHEG